MFQLHLVTAPISMKENKRERKKCMKKVSQYGTNGGENSLAHLLMEKGEWANREDENSKSERDAKAKAIKSLMMWKRESEKTIFKASNAMIRMWNKSESSLLLVLKSHVSTRRRKVVFIYLFICAPLAGRRQQQKQISLFNTFHSQIKLESSNSWRNIFSFRYLIGFNELFIYPSNSRIKSHKRNEKWFSTFQNKLRLIGRMCVFLVNERNRCTK